MDELVVHLGPAPDVVEGLPVELPDLAVRIEPGLMRRSVRRELASVRDGRELAALVDLGAEGVESR